MHEHRATTDLAGRALSTSVVTSAADLADAGWDDLVIGSGRDLPAHHLYTSALWLRRYELFGHWDQRYLLASEEETLLGGLATHRVDSRNATAQIRIDNLFDGGSPAEDGGASIAPCRVAGGLIDGRTGALTRPGLSLRQRAAVVDRLFSEAEDVAAELGERSVVCRCIDAGDLLLRRVLRGRGYVEVPGPDHLILTPPPGGLDGYIASFPNRYRNMIRREIRKLRDAGVTVTVEVLTRDLVAAVLPLITQLNEKHDLGIQSDDARGSLEMLRRSFGKDAYAVVARAGGRPVGFVELVLYRGNAWASQAGFDYGFQGALPLYFGVLFYGVMDFASSARLSKIDYSFGTDVAKTSRGCTRRPTVRAVRALDPAEHARLRQRP